MMTMRMKRINWERLLSLTRPSVGKRREHSTATATTTEIRPGHAIAVITIDVDVDVVGSAIVAVTIVVVAVAMTVIIIIRAGLSWGRNRKGILRIERRSYRG